MARATPLLHIGLLLLTLAYAIEHNAFHPRVWGQGAVGVSGLPIFLTGAMGFVGRAVVQRFVGKSYEVARGDVVVKIVVELARASLV